MRAFKSIAVMLIGSLYSQAGLLQAEQYANSPQRNNRKAYAFWNQPSLKALGLHGAAKNKLSQKGKRKRARQSGVTVKAMYK